MKTIKSWIQRFEEKIFYSPDGCWYWTACLDSWGYGMSSAPGKKTRKAHRLSYEYFKGEIPDGLLALHTCDNPACVNPDHIFLGTNQDNMTDMIKKKRDRHVCGEDHALSKLTNEQVIEMRLRYQKGDIGTIALAKLYNMGKSQVCNIVSNKFWKHIAICIILFICSSCASGIYWQNDRHTASGKHTYFTAGWGSQTSCKTYNQLPIKKVNYNRQAYWKSK